MSYTKFEFPIIKDNYIITEEILAMHNYGNVYRVICNNNNCKYTLHMINLNLIKELELENKLKNVIINNNKIIHWAYFDNELFNNKVPIDKTNINFNQKILRLNYYFIITYYNTNDILKI